MVILGLVLQAVSVLMLVARLRRRLTSYLGAVFVLIACIYHGLSQILIWVFPGQDPYLSLVEGQYRDQFVLWISAAICLFTIVYLRTLGRAGVLEVRAPPPKADVDYAMSFFPWQLMVIAAAPLVYLTVRGAGFGANGNSTSGLAATVGLSEQYLVIAIVLAGVGFIRRFGARWTLPVLAVQCAVTATVGERALVVQSAIMLLFLLAWIGIRPRRRSVVIGVVLLLFLGWTISAARATQGRISTTAGTSLRLSSLEIGATHLFTNSTREQIAYTLGYRFDGNSFGAMELQAIDSGEPTLGLRPVVNDLDLAIPSFINPNKTSTDLGYRVEKVWAEEHLALTELETSPGVYEDILPTQLGETVGYWGPTGLLAVAFVSGFLFARLDRWLGKRLSAARILIGLGVLNCLLSYEGSFDVWTTTARGVLLLLIVVWAFQSVRAVGKRVSPAARVPSI
jgi:hypothetical protein